MPASGRGFRDIVPWLAGILVAAFLVFSPALHSQFVRWDDYAYIVDNPIIRDLSPRNVLHILEPRTFVLDNYHPLTIMSYAVEYRLAGTSPRLYHLDNIMLHLLNTVLVACLVWLLTRRPIATQVAAALFAVHPLRVESVAWAAERKDLLYTFFLMLSLIAYVFYARDPSRRRYYVASWLLLLLSCLSKAQAVVLPLAFFLVDYWFGRRNIRRLVLEKVPFLALSLALGYWATIAQATSITPTRLAEYSAIERVLIASYNLVTYVYKLVFPYKLAAFYGYPADIGTLRWSVPVLFGLIGLFALIARRSKHGLVGVLFFLLTIAPVIQILPIGDAIVADRFTYVPYIGLFLLLGHLADRGASRPGLPGVLTRTLIVAQLAVFAVASYRQTETWRDTESLWYRVLRVDPSEPRAHNNLGVSLLGQGRIDEAIAHLQQCIANGAHYDRINEAYSNLGAAYSRAGRDDQALEACNRAIGTGLARARDWLNRGLVYARLGQHERAIADYTKAIELDPTNAEGLYNRGNALRRLKRVEQAIADYSRAIELDGTYASAYVNRGNSYADVGAIERAVEDYNAALTLRPQDGPTYLNRSKAYFRLGKFGNALEDYNRAASLGASDESFRDMLRGHVGANRELGSR